MSRETSHKIDLSSFFCYLSWRIRRDRPQQQSTLSLENRAEKSSIDPKVAETKTVEKLTKTKNKQKTHPNNDTISEIRAFHTAKPTPTQRTVALLQLQSWCIFNVTLTLFDFAVILYHRPHVFPSTQLYIHTTRRHYVGSVRFRNAFRCCYNALWDGFTTSLFAKGQRVKEMRNFHCSGKRISLCNAVDLEANSVLWYLGNVPASS